MRILITSDVHGKKELLEEVCKLYEGYRHLNAGDIGINVDKLSLMNIEAVKGNTDFFKDLPLERIITIEDKNILLVHGHTFDVKRTLDRLLVYAKMLNIDIVIFGHTHERFNEVIDNIHFINPGALSDFERSYAIYENGNVEFLNL